jgi:Flp pilus assembly protein TadB
VTLLVALLAGVLVFVTTAPSWEPRRLFARRVEAMFSLETTRKLGEMKPGSLEYRLAASGLNLTPASFRLCAAALGIAGALLVWPFLPDVPTAAIGVVVFCMPFAWLDDRVSGRGRAIDKLLPLAMSRITAGILAGGTVSEVLLQVAQSLASEGANPLSPELEAAGKEMLSGNRIDALGRLAARSPSVSLANLAYLLSSYTEVGGPVYAQSLSEAGARIQEILAARARAQAKAGDAMLTARIIPAALLLVLLYLSRDPLMRASLSAFPIQVIVAGTIGLMAAGYLVMRSMVREAV